MIPKGLFTQIGMIIISISIIVTYIKPTFAHIGETQGEIEKIQEQRSKVQTIYDKLDALNKKIENNISEEDKSRLYTYLPDEKDLDEISIRRDLLLITQEAEVLYRDTSAEEATQSNNSRTQTNDTDTEKDDMPTPHPFTLSTEAPYDDLKNLFSLLEQNNYPFEVSSVNIETQDGDFLTAEIGFNVYSYNDLTSLTVK